MSLDIELFTAAMALAQPRAKTLVEAVKLAQFLFVSEEEFQEAMNKASGKISP